MPTYTPKPGQPLTDRQLQILRLAAAGLEYADIAADLYLTEDTVKHHMWRARRKLGAHRGDKLLDLARQRGLIGPQTTGGERDQA